MAVLRIKQNGEWIPVGEYPLSKVALSGSYADLLDKPESDSQEDFIVTGQVETDFENPSHQQSIENLSCTFDKILESHKEGKNIYFYLTLINMENAVVKIPLITASDYSDNPGAMFAIICSYPQFENPCVYQIAFYPSNSAKLVCIPIFSTIIDYVDEQIGDIDTALENTITSLENIVQIQESLMIPDGDEVEY